MIDNLVFYIATAIFALSFTQSNILYRITGLFSSFCLMAIAVNVDLTLAFISIVAGASVHLLMIFTIKEYQKKDNDDLR